MQVLSRVTRGTWVAEDAVGDGTELAVAFWVDEELGSAGDTVVAVRTVASHTVPLTQLGGDEHHVVKGAGKEVVAQLPTYVELQVRLDREVQVVVRIHQSHHRNRLLFRRKRRGLSRVRLQRVCRQHVVLEKLVLYLKAAVSRVEAY